uniref:Uncharacterized protein n=1 Tax=uncultured marine group II/III euryarchaeote KM3_203_F09 TaxID=1456423 RepID=A0A075H0R0_9EURY|nr:hypothetical protein [uncultured marine group II/III euryarchaeote KM3_203_F09]
MRAFTASSSRSCGPRCRPRAKAVGRAQAWGSARGSIGSPRGGSGWVQDEELRFGCGARPARYAEYSAFLKREGVAGRPPRDVKRSLRPEVYQVHQFKVYLDSQYISFGRDLKKSGEPLPPPDRFGARREALTFEGRNLFLHRTYCAGNCVTLHHAVVEVALCRSAASVAGKHFTSSY